MRCMSYNVLLKWPPLYWNDPRTTVNRIQNNMLLYRVCSCPSLTYTCFVRCATFYLVGLVIATMRHDRDLPNLLSFRIFVLQNHRSVLPRMICNRLIKAPNQSAQSANSVKCSQPTSSTIPSYFFIAPDQTALERQDDLALREKNSNLKRHAGLMKTTS